VTSKNYSLRLEGLSVADGEIPLRDLALIGEALQLTATRIARQVSGGPERGRPGSYIERISELRLTGLSGGSTTLELSLGDQGTLDLIGGDEDQVSHRLEEAFSAIATNRPPAWVNPPIAKSIRDVITRIQASGARQVTAAWTSPTEPIQRVINIDTVNLEVWQVVAELEVERVSMAGRLDRVDLRARRFRIRDDVGHDIMLEDVVDLDTAATLIGHRVIASGEAERSGDRIVRIIEPRLALEDLPEGWSIPPVDVVPAGAAIPARGIDGVSDEDLEVFLLEIHR
jgi:hypothetical protein